MLHRETSKGRICITQPTHAWVAGQIARVWGNDRFGQVTPWEDVCLGAEQHDIGWQRWEANPTFNQATGYPHSFAEIPTTVSVDLWTRAKEAAMPLGQYAALLISLHGTGIFQRFTGWQKSTEAAQRVRRYLQTEEQFQHHLIEALQADPYYKNYASADAIARNRQLIAIWDWLSLMICMAAQEPRQFEHVPTATGETTLTLTPLHLKQNCFQVTPWAFQTDSVSLEFEGRTLQQPYPDEITMNQALQTAHRVKIAITLTPG